MNIPDKVFRLITCCLSSDSHFINQAFLLQCGGNACRLCVETSIDTYQERECSFCGAIHRLDQLPALNPSVNLLIETYSDEISKQIKQNLNNKLKHLNKMELSLNNNLNFIEMEINLKVDTLKIALDDLKNEFQRDLNKIRMNWKEVFPMKSNIPSNYAELCKLNENINSCIDKLASIRFQENTISIEKSIIGSIEYPIYYDLNKIVNKKSVKIESKRLSRCCLIDKNRILITDCDGKQLKVISIENGELLWSYNPKSLLQQPAAICSTKNGLYVGDCSRHEILYFDYDLNHLQSFAKDLVKSPNSLEYDNGTLFVSDWTNDSLAAVNAQNGVLLNQITIDSPEHLKVYQSKLFVISGITIEIKKGTRKIDRITKGSNCIYIINKTSLKLINEIKLPNWLSPTGLHVDSSSGCLLTTAHLLDDSSNISDNRFLFLFNELGSLVKQIQLDINITVDFIYFNKKLVTCVDNLCTFYDFE